MKYKDKNTLNSWNKQVDKLDQEDSDRKLRRKRERDLANFSKSICLVIDKDWWDCVSTNQKTTLMYTWQNMRQRSLYYNTTCIKFEDWVKEIKKTTEIDKALYREKTINKLLSCGIVSEK
jgi:16S rRNA C967 or C1407 C5-methylase (RsmB/RsmF family)